MTKVILNEGYDNEKNLFLKEFKEKIFSKKKGYIDLSMCAGSLLLGHNHQVFRNSLKKFLNKKISNFAAPNIYADIYSKNIKKIIKNSEKIIFCNSGTEAIIKSLRISRAVNKKKKIALVTGGWHGSVDQLLYKSSKNLKPTVLSSGLFEENIKNLILIPYNDINKTKVELRI